MEAAELDILLEELETRVERLRSLYEQYFLGIEKIPPQVAQKDVDRRLYSLRREQIRNTARRFKLQTIIQRYNTFQQYWMRIMREIENGTYRRHVLRAERTVGVTNLLTPAERKRLGLPEPIPQPAAPVDPLPPSDPPRRVPSPIERDLSLLVDDDLDALDTKGLFELGNELDDPLLSSMPPPAHKRKPSLKPLAARRSTRPTAVHRGTVPHETAQPALASTDRVPDSAVPVAPGRLRLPASSAVAGRGLPPLPKTGVPRGAPPKIPGSPIIAVEGRQPGPQANLPTESAKRLGRSAQPIDSGTTDSVDVKPPLALQSGGLAGPGPARPPMRPPPRQPPPAQPPVSPARPAPPSSLGSARESVPRGLPHPRESVIPRPSRPPSRPMVASKDGRPETATMPTAERAKPPPPPRRIQNPPDPTRANAPVTPTEALDRTRILQLAEKLRDARMQTREASPVSVDDLAKKLESTAEELRKKHVGRRIDFDVVIKDGKAIVKAVVKPIVR